MDYTAVPTETNTSDELNWRIQPRGQDEETIYLESGSVSLEPTKSHDSDENDGQNGLSSSLLLSLVALALTYVGESTSLRHATIL
jgi:hypothetical protein